MAMWRSWSTTHSRGHVGALGHVVDDHAVVDRGPEPVRGEVVAQPRDDGRGARLVVPRGPRRRSRARAGSARANGLMPLPHRYIRPGLPGSLTLTAAVDELVQHADELEPEQREDAGGAGRGVEPGVDPVVVEVGRAHDARALRGRGRDGVLGRGERREVGRQVHVGVDDGEGRRPLAAARRRVALVHVLVPILPVTQADPRGSPRGELPDDCDCLPVCATSRTTASLLTTPHPCLTAPRSTSSPPRRLPLVAGDTITAPPPSRARRRCRCVARKDRGPRCHGRARHSSGQRPCWRFRGPRRRRLACGARPAPRPRDYVHGRHEPQACNGSGYSASSLRATSGNARP